MGGKRAGHLSRCKLSCASIVLFISAPDYMILSLYIFLRCYGFFPSNLHAAIIGAVVGAAFGGTRHMIVGPAAGMALIVGITVSKFGLEVAFYNTPNNFVVALISNWLQGLLVCTIGTGILQALTGVFGLGKRFLHADVAFFLLLMIFTFIFLQRP